MMWAFRRAWRRRPRPTRPSRRALPARQSAMSPLRRGSARRPGATPPSAAPRSPRRPPRASRAIARPLPATITSLPATITTARSDTAGSAIRALAMRTLRQAGILPRLFPGAARRSPRAWAHRMPRAALTPLHSPRVNSAMARRAATHPRAVLTGRRATSPQRPAGPTQRRTTSVATTAAREVLADPRAASPRRPAGLTQRPTTSVATAAARAASPRPAAPLRIASAAVVAMAATVDNDVAGTEMEVQPSLGLDRPDSAAARSRREILLSSRRRSRISSCVGCSDGSRMPCACCR